MHLPPRKVFKIGQPHALYDLPDKSNCFYFLMTIISINLITGDIKNRTLQNHQKNPILI